MSIQINIPKPQEVEEAINLNITQLLKFASSEHGFPMSIHLFFLLQ